MNDFLKKTPPGTCDVTSMTTWCPVKATAHTYHPAMTNHLVARYIDSCGPSGDAPISFSDLPARLIMNDFLKTYVYRLCCGPVHLTPCQILPAAPPVAPLPQHLGRAAPAAVQVGHRPAAAATAQHHPADPRPGARSPRRATPRRPARTQQSSSSAGSASCPCTRSW